MQAAALSSSVLRIPSFPSGSCGALDGAQSVRCSWRRRQRRASREENTRGHTRGNPVFTISEVKVHPHVLGCWVLRDSLKVCAKSVWSEWHAGANKTCTVRVHRPIDPSYVCLFTPQKANDWQRLFFNENVLIFFFKQAKPNVMCATWSWSERIPLLFTDQLWMYAQRDFQKDFNIKMIICPQKVIPDVLHFLNVQYPYLFWVLIL